MAVTTERRSGRASKHDWRREGSRQMRVPVDTYDKVLRSATRNRRTMTQEIAVLVNRALGEPDEPTEP